MRIRQLDLLKYGHFTNAVIDIPGLERRISRCC